MEIIMINKIKILGIGNKEKYNYIIIKKNKHFFKWLYNILQNAFDYVPDLDKEEYIDKNNKFISKKKNITNYFDKHESHEFNNARIDIFYGKEKIFLTIITSLKNRKKIMDNLEKYSEFIKPKRINLRKTKK